MPNGFTDSAQWDPTSTPTEAEGVIAQLNRNIGHIRGNNIRLADLLKKLERKIAPVPADAPGHPVPGVSGSNVVTLDDVLGDTRCAVDEGDQLANKLSEILRLL